MIVVAGYKAKDGRLRANGRDITFPDGRTLFMGSSGTGAPKDGRDPNEKPKPKGHGDACDSDSQRPASSCSLTAASRRRAAAAGAAGLPRAAHARRHARPQRHLAGEQHRELGPRSRTSRGRARSFALGAAFSVPPGLGVVDGGEIPYLPAALEKKKTEPRRAG